jgi:hypothetical protein
MSRRLLILDKFSGVKKLGQKNTRRMSIDGKSWLSEASSRAFELKILAYLESARTLAGSTTSVVINRLGFGNGYSSFACHYLILVGLTASPVSSSALTISVGETEHARDVYP